MTAFRRGDVVLVHFPYADLVTWGQRPAPVVQDENVQTGLEQYVLAEITTTPRTGATRLFVGKSSVDGQAMSLLHDSVIMADVLQTTEAGLIRKHIGSCPCMDKVDTALRALLRL